MKLFLIAGVIFMLVTVNVQASTIILKGGRTITGDIIQKDNARIVVKDDDSTLTYYKEDIVSIDGESLTAWVNDKGSDAEKEKLIDQLLEVYPTSNVVSSWVEANFSAEQQQTVLTALNNEQNIAALTEIRKEGYMQYYSSASLKGLIKLYGSPETKGSLEDLKQFLIHTTPKLNKQMRQEAKKAVS